MKRKDNGPVGVSVDREPAEEARRRKSSGVEPLLQKSKVRSVGVKNSAELDDPLCATRLGQGIENDYRLVGARDDGFGDGD